MCVHQISMLLGYLIIWYKEAPFNHPTHLYTPLAPRLHKATVEVIEF